MLPVVQNPDRRMQSVEEVKTRLNQLSSPELQLKAFLRSRLARISQGLYERAALYGISRCELMIYTGIGSCPYEDKV
jgi:hypothetical protein